MSSPRRTVRAGWVRVLGLALLGWLGPEAPAISSRAADPPAPTRVGRVVTLEAPWGDAALRRLRRATQALAESAATAAAQGVLFVELEPGPCEFGRAVDVARFLTGDEVAALHTVAVIPRSLSGHAVLVALACDELVLGAEAELGPAGADETVIGPDLRSVYREIAERTRSMPVDVALGLLDPALEVHVVETDVSREFALGERLAELRAAHPVVSDDVLFRAGEPGRLSGRQARELGLVSFLAADVREAAAALGLPPAALIDDWALAGDWRPVRVLLAGEINAAATRRLQRLLEDRVTQTGVNLLILEIDSAGGSPAEALGLAGYLVDLDPDQVRSVAYVPREARGEAALVALACDELLLGEGATLGGPGPFPLAEAEIRPTATALAAIARAKQRSPALAEALIDPQVQVHQARRRDNGATEFVTRAQADAAPADWELGPLVTPAGKRFAPTAAEAVELGLARAEVASFAEVRQLLDLTDDPALVEPTWVDALVDFLNQPGISGLLLMLALSGLYIEAHTPGLGLPGLMGSLCVVLLFWSKVLGGTAEWLEVVMFLTGVACLLFEVFVLPGFGVFGLAGAVLVLGSLVLASQTFVWPRNPYELHELEQSLWQLVGGAAGAVAAAVVLKRYLFTRPVFGGVLGPFDPAQREEIDRRERLASFEHLLGQRAEVATQLSPAGKIRVGGQLIDVVSDGELIEVGASVEVVETHGSRVIVRRVAGNVAPRA